jgi:DNA-binding transcriptional MerR regulator
MNQDNNLLTISEVSRRLNIPKHTLRFWEKEFDGLFSPLRTKGGQRRFAPQHLTLIGEIKRRKEKGMNLSEIKREFLNTTEEGLGQESEIDRLASRVAEVVKTEVFHFFEMERLKD